MKSHKWRRAIDGLGFDNVLKVGREAIWPHIARPKGSPQKWNQMKSVSTIVYLCACGLLISAWRKQENLHHPNHAKYGSGSEVHAAHQILLPSSTWRMMWKVSFAIACKLSDHWLIDCSDRFKAVCWFCDTPNQNFQNVFLAPNETMDKGSRNETGRKPRCPQWTSLVEWGQALERQETWRDDKSQRSLDMQRLQS